MNYISKLMLCLGLLMPMLTMGQTHTPASFGSYKEDFLSKIDFPDINEGNPLTIKCAGRITDRGKFDTIICLDDANFDGDKEISRNTGSEIAKVTESIRVNPARVDGRRVEVWYNFSVVFQVVNGAQQVDLVDNHFRNSDSYGEEYIAAQRYNGDLSSCISSLRGAVFMQASISEGGEVQSVTPMGNNSSGGGCTDRLMEDMQQSTYIPAFFDGNPVASTYVEIFTGTN